MKLTPVSFAIFLTSCCIGLLSISPQIEFGLFNLSKLCNFIIVWSPAKPGATSFDPPENPAKKCGSTNPVVIFTSASTQCLFRKTSTSFKEVFIFIKEDFSSQV